jgi:hypothetical protein
LVSVVAVSVVAACQVGSDETPEQAEDTSPLYSYGVRTLNIVAHQDDDILGLNPNLAYSVGKGITVRTVYLTAGDAGFGCQGYWVGRETGIKLFYEKMAGMTPGTGVWTDEPLTLSNGKKMRLLKLTGKPISLVFMGLPNQDISVRELWGGSIASLSTVPDTRLVPQQTYTRAELIETLRLLMVNFDARHVNTLDSSKIWGDSLPFDHPDHVGTGLFALAAKERYTTQHTASMHRMYNAVFEEQNVSVAEKQLRTDLFAVYYPHDRKICTTGTADVCPEPHITNTQSCDDPNVLYTNFYPYFYPIDFVYGASGGLRGPAAGDGSAQCLKANAASAGSALVMAACDPTSALQQWQLKKDGALRLGGVANLCASSSFTPGTRGAGITLQPCVSGAASQKFTLSTVGQLRGPDATCVQAAGTSLTVQECSNAAAQRNWSLQVASSVASKLSTGLADADIPNAPAYYATLNLADVNGDGRADVCVRHATQGIRCAFHDSGTGNFSSFSPKLARFRDSDGFGSAPYGSTVQLADINGDGRSDVCGRAADGIYCATWDNATLQFTGYAKRSNGITFSDLVGYNWSASVYRSLRVVDVTGDGKADVCSRNMNGIECAVNNGSGSFGGVTQWISSEFSDALFWNDDDSGTTLRYGDIDGDGKRDVCGRGLAGMICALNDGANHFHHPHLWSDTGDFSDGEGWALSESFYGSIRLVDVSGDGKADVCGRGMNGVVCGLSMGSSFSIALPFVTVTPYSDADGYGPAKYGATLAFADYTGDGRPDICARGPVSGGVALRCATGVGVAP